MTLRFIALLRLISAVAFLRKPLGANAGLGFVDSAVEMERRTERLAGRASGEDGNSRFTYFEMGWGACGETNMNSDYPLTPYFLVYPGLLLTGHLSFTQVVAISAEHWDGGSHCGKTVTITYRGKTAQALVVDKLTGK
ncbi:hypothetical protein FA15DRAFT_651054 [Coprinopsis marcescibilis]|uniref:Uncharacterized protein n=1 Tax=Coprinopsis marcescibilis TaxID=230819 RepID=A0A5C3LCE8_COPMA|nr:hypothetical protein FA15DRAFT_651054 [Coprinopsis marcescibilis]